MTEEITIYNEKEIGLIAASANILSHCLALAKRAARAGVVLRDLDNLVFREVKAAGAKPSFFGFQPSGATKPYLAAICTSVNEVIVHGFPDNRKLVSGDVLKIDFGVEYKGYFSDAAVTIPIGKVSTIAERLIAGTKQALLAGIKSCRPGKNINEIGKNVERTAEKFGLTVIRELTGHGVGRSVHEEPAIYNFYTRRPEITIKPGMVFAIEPMLSLGTWKIKQLEDESWATADNSLSAQFEHTVAITSKGPKILTKI